MSLTASVVSEFFGALCRPLGGNFLSGGRGLAFAHLLSPFITGYPWTNLVGYGTKYADPITLPTGTGQGVVFNKDAIQNTVFLASSGSPFLTAYVWSSSGFGTKFANMATLPGGTGCVGLDCRAVAGEADYSIATCDNSGAGPFFGTWRFSKTGAGWGTKYAQPAALPPAAGQNMRFSPSGGALVCAHNTTPFVSAWPFTSAGAGTKLADPAAGPTAGGTGSAFNTTGSALVVAHNFNAATKSYSAWAWTDSVGFGTKYADSTTLPGGGAPNGFGATFLASKVVAIGHGTNGTIGGVTACRWTDAGGFGTSYAQISPLFAGQFQGTNWNQIGNTLFAGTTILSFLRAQIWSDALGFGTFYALPATPLPSTGQRVAVAN